jgi:hypothetical protein
MDFREIGRFVSEDRFSLEYLWNVRGDVVCSSCDFSLPYREHILEPVRGHQTSNNRKITK